MTRALLAGALIGASLLTFALTGARANKSAAAPEPARVLTVGVCDTAGPIEVESSGGTMTPTAYATLKDGFDA